MTGTQVQTQTVVIAPELDRRSRRTSSVRASGTGPQRKSTTFCTCLYVFGTFLRSQVPNIYQYPRSQEYGLLYGTYRVRG